MALTVASISDVRSAHCGEQKAGAVMVGVGRKQMSKCTITRCISILARKNN